MTSISPIRAVLNQFVGNFPNWSHITPFTYQDGLTNVKLLESLIDYVSNTLVPYVDDELQAHIDAWILQMQTMINDLNDSLDGFEDSLAEQLADNLAAVNAAIATIVDSSVEVQDPVVAGIFGDTGSDTRDVTDDLYAVKATETTVATHTAQIGTNTTNITSLTTALGNKANTADVTASLATKANTADVTASLATKANTADVTASLATKANIDVVDDIAVTVKRGYPYTLDTKFAKMVNGIITRTNDVRVAVIGDSHGTVTYTAFPDQSTVRRLANRAGANGVLDLSVLASNPGNQGMVWYNGSIGGAQSNGYAPPATITKLGYLQPDYVFHIIGSNDCSVGTSLEVYKNNVAAACAAIETAAPNAVNVLVHVHAFSYATPPISWDSYGAKMAEIAADNPAKRVYIDADLAFKTLNMTTNRAGLMNSDGSHLNSLGSKRLADAIGMVIGIPSETDFANASQWYPITVNAGPYNAPAFCSNVVDILPASYPRFVTVEFNAFIWGTSVYTDLWINHSLPTPAVTRKFRVGKAGENMMTCQSRVFLPANTAGQVVLAVDPQGATVQMNADNIYTYASVMATPA